MPNFRVFYTWRDSGGTLSTVIEAETPEDAAIQLHREKPSAIVGKIKLVRQHQVA